MDSVEKFALSIMLVFGALVIGGLMAVGIAWNDKPGFLFALAAAIIVWISAFAVLFGKPTIYGVLLVLAGCLVAASIAAVVT
jgi:hypothetical protein